LLFLVVLFIDDLVLFASLINVEIFILNIKICFYHHLFYNFNTIFNIWQIYRKENGNTLFDWSSYWQFCYSCRGQKYVHVWRS